MLQSMNALASAFDANIRDLEHEGTEMINELLGKEVTILMSYAGTLDMVRGQIVEIQEPWLKLLQKKNVSTYINTSQIIRVTPQ